MSTLALIVLTFHSLLVAWLLHDSFRTANRWADIFEAHILPAWARWDTYGDPVSWVHHGMVAAGVALYGAAWGWILPDSAAMGALVGASVAFVAYGIREGMSAWESWRAGRPHVWTHPLPHRVGWAVDGLMDLVGPGLVLAGCLAWGGGVSYVLVEWVDAAYHEDVGAGEVVGPMQGEAAGHLLRDDEVCVTVALESFGDGTYRRALAIPRGMVIRVRPLVFGCAE